MNLRGEISSISNDGSKARVFVIDKGVLTAELPIASHVQGLIVNDKVAVMFFSNSLSDGIIIARW